MAKKIKYYEGKKVIEWAKELGVTRTTIYNNINNYGTPNPYNDPNFYNRKNKLGAGRPKSNTTLNNLYYGLLYKNYNDKLGVFYYYRVSVSVTDKNLKKRKHIGPFNNLDECKKNVKKENTKLRLERWSQYKNIMEKENAK